MSIPVVSAWEDTLPVAEVFGPTWQGEGPYCGRVVSFVRLGLCNLSCEWCDTPFTWDRQNYDLDETCPPAKVDMVISKIVRQCTHRTVISGGEPLIWQHTQAWRRLVADLSTLTPEAEVHVETNGTIVPRRDVCIAHYSVSPKLTTRDPEKRRINNEALEAFNELAQVEGRACFKFVCAAADDVTQVQMFVEAHDLSPDDVWIMPQGTLALEVLAVHRQLAERALDYGFNTTTRLHTLLYDNERSR